MAKDTRVSFENASPVPSKPTSGRGRQSRATERQISYEETENCVNEMSESFPAFTKGAHRLMRQVSESFNYRTIKVVLILSVILNLLLAIPFGIFFGFWLSQNHEAARAAANAAAAGAHNARLIQTLDPSGQTSKEDSTNAVVPKPQSHEPQKGYKEMDSCFPCREMRRLYGISYLEKVLVRSKNDICCTNGHRWLQLNAEIGGPCRDTPRAPRTGAHLMLNVTQTKKNLVRESVKRENVMTWISSDKDGEPAYVTSGLEYSNGVITVKEPGRYHVYSQVTLSSIGRLEDEGRQERIIVHSLAKRNRQGEVSTLVLAQVTLKPHEVRSNNIEGSISFQEGEQVYVYVSFPSYLKDSRPANIFGMFIL